MINNNNKDSFVIQTKSLCREFNVRLKSEGIAASIKNFFSPVYRKVEAVKDLDLEIVKGEIIGFLGPNGAGKTTTLKMLSGLLVPTGGTIDVAGYTPFERENDFLKSVSLVMGQKQNLWWDLPPAETFQIHKEIYQIPENEFQNRISELVEMLEIEECLETQTRKLSLGQRMRCELAVSLLHQPSILFLDEPTIGLDILMQKKIRRFLKDYHQRFKPTILLTSHYMDDVAALASRVIVIDLGKKIFDGSLSSLTASFNQNKIIRIVSSEKISAKDYSQVKLISEHGPQQTFSVPRNKVGEFASKLYSTGKIEDLTIEDVPLEDIIGDLFTNNQNSEPPK